MVEGDEVGVAVWLGVAEGNGDSLAVAIPFGPRPDAATAGTVGKSVALGTGLGGGLVVSGETDDKAVSVGATTQPAKVFRSNNKQQVANSQPG